MKSLLFISLSLFLAGFGTASKHATKTSSDLPTYTVIPHSKGLPPPPDHGFTKGLPPLPVQELSKGLPPKDKVTTPKGAAPPTPDAPLNPIEAIGSLTPECQAALFSIVANPEFFQCVPITALLPLLPIVSDPTALPELLKDPAKNLPPVLGPVFDGLCAAPKCSDEGVAASLSALDGGCQADEKNVLIEIATGIVTFYSPLRDSICFKDNKKEYCVFETLEKVTSLPPPPVKVIDGGLIDAIAFSEPKEICTPCNKAIVNTIFNFLNADTNHSVEFLAKIGVPSTFLTIGKLFVGVKCGYQFLDGNVGHPEDTDPDDFNYQLSQGLPVPSGASNVKGSLTMMIGAFLASVFLF